ncbi:ABC transporter permease [Neotabrizicola shimadae]|uniref:ABC transporter permease n=1 Tax=Neotabrizicola shimadae TaxID=2807096 RepID=A0A8G0ZSF1_9RHOB|nr:ABC transporter permease [Neotabrizicola shimadae]QYZ69604.1 ABC transporter permease [Neotabrizicola shimadae]
MTTAPASTFAATLIPRLRLFVIPLVLVGLIALFSALSPVFLTPQNLTNILMQNAYVVIAAVGLSFVMISGGIDLSIGYQMSVVGVVTAVFMKWLNVPVAPSIALGIACGVAMGLTNGLLSITLKVHSLIVTLGTLTVYQGLSYIISNQQAIINLPPSFKFIGQGYLGPVPVAVILMLACVALAAFILNVTSFGRMIYAIGGNEDAAFLTGIPVIKVKIAVYSLCGLFSAIAAVVLFARSGSAASSTGPGTEFTAITAAVLGGISFKGGEGKMLGLVAGVLILGVLSNGMQLVGLNNYAQYIVKGLVLLAAVGFDTWQNTPRTKRKAA